MYLNKRRILNMEAGRGMDALIAEKIFGWTDCKVNNNNWAYGKPKDFTHQYDALVRIEDYSTNMEAAWEVVEKMSYGQTECVFDLILRFKGYWAIFKYDDGKQITSEQQRTAPLAICKAALLAIIESTESPSEAEAEGDNHGH